MASLALLASCTNNPSPLGAGAYNNGTTFGYVSQDTGDQVLFNPFAPSNPATDVWTGPVEYSYGGSSYVVTGSSGGQFRRNSLTLGDPSVPMEGSPNQDILFLQGGVGGPGDYFLRWNGEKAPDASLDYSSMSIFFLGATTNVDLTNFTIDHTHYYDFKGVSFYARGEGNFGVCIAAGAPPSGQTGPYLGYNFYEYVFGSDLHGDRSKWRQFSIEFSQMQQLYGQAVDIRSVLKSAWGLQFQQELPATKDFQLDVDYVRFY